MTDSLYDSSDSSHSSLVYFYFNVYVTVYVTSMSHA